MFKMLRALYPTLYYFVIAQKYQLSRKPLPKALRNRYLKDWGHWTLARMGVSLSVIGKPSSKSCILLGNHISYLDIPLLCNQAPVLFLAKAELARWPLIGSIGRCIETVFIDRSSKASRQAGAAKIAEKVLKAKEFIAVFPSGTTSIDESVPWRAGAFRIAHENAIPVQAFRINYEPRSVAAFVGDDWFLVHMYKLLKTSQIKASIEFLPPKLIRDLAKDMEEIKAWCMQR